MRHRLKRYSLGVLAALALVWAWAWAGAAEAAETLRIAVNPSKGFAMMDDAGRLSGFDVEIAQALCEEMGVRCDIVTLRFAETMEQLRSGQGVDMAVSSVLRTPEREGTILFSDRYWRSTSSFIARAGTLRTADAATLAGKRIAVNKGSRQGTFVRDRYGSVAGIVEYPNADAALDAVVKGEVEVALQSTLTSMLYMLSESGRALEVVGDPLTEQGLGGDCTIAFPLGREALRDRVNVALKTILLNGRYDTINSRYFPFRIY